MEQWDGNQGRAYICASSKSASGQFGSPAAYLTSMANAPLEERVALRLPLAFWTAPPVSILV